jgi:hypothetical protein
LPKGSIVDVKQLLLVFGSIASILLGLVLLYANMIVGNFFEIGYLVGDAFGILFLAGGLTGIWAVWRFNRIR